MEPSRFTYGPTLIWLIAITSIPDHLHWLYVASEHFKSHCHPALSLFSFGEADKRCIKVTLSLKWSLLREQEGLDWYSCKHETILTGWSLKLSIPESLKMEPSLLYKLAPYKYSASAEVRATNLSGSFPIATDLVLVAIFIADTKRFSAKRAIQAIGKEATCIFIPGTIHRTLFTSEWKEVLRWM